MYAKLLTSSRNRLSLPLILILRFRQVQLRWWSKISLFRFNINMFLLLMLRIRKYRVHRRVNLIIPFLCRTPRRIDGADTETFLSSSITTMNFLFLFRRSMTVVEFIKEAAGVTKWRLTVGSF